MKVLVLDSSYENRRSIAELLGELGDVVVQGAVADVHSALRAVADASPDVLVTASRHGQELIEGLRRLSRAPALVVIAPEASDDERARYAAAGVAGYVAGDLSELPQVIETLLARRFASGTIPPAETQRLLGRITAGVVHDMNNYLGVLEVMLTLLRRHPDDPQLWDQARSALDAMARLTARLLGHVRGVVPEPERLDLGEIVRETLAVAQRLVPSSVNTVANIAENSQPILGFRSELEQLVLNLVVNALDAMPKGGELEVSVQSMAGNATLLVVADRGVGMPADRATGGLGLGIVHAVVDHHRGALRIAPRPDGGTIVTIALPTHVEPA